MSYQAKYLKYKEKYLALKNQYGGSEIQIDIHEHTKDQVYEQFPWKGNSIDLPKEKSIKDLKLEIYHQAQLYRLFTLSKRKFKDFVVDNQILKIKCDDGNIIELTDECTLEAHGITNGTIIYLDFKNSKVVPMKVALIGDSTIDNIYWIINQGNGEATAISQEKSVSGQLRKMMEDTIIDNLAADGFTTDNVLRGGSTSISFNARKSVDPFPISAGVTFKPLDWLENKDYTHAVLSIGGNDIREVLPRLSQSEFKLKPIIEKLQENYEKIVKDICNEVPNLILMTQYQPSMKQSNYEVYEKLGDYNVDNFNGLTPQEKMHLLMKIVYKPIFAFAQKLKLPIIDLTNSFDPMDGTLYVSQIEPSVEGGKIIATLIKHVLSNHKFNENESTLYKIKGSDINSELNQGVDTWKIDI